MNCAEPALGYPECTTPVHNYDGETQGVRWRIRAVEHLFLIRIGRSNENITLKDGTRTTGHYCAYIEVPKDLAGWFEDEVPVHGGVTWGGDHGTGHTDEYPDGTKCAEGCEVLGWDYHHLTDYECDQTYERIESELLEAVRALVERIGQRGATENGKGCGHMCLVDELDSIKLEIYKEGMRSAEIEDLIEEDKVAAAAFALGQMNLVLFDICDRLEAAIDRMRVGS